MLGLPAGQEFCQSLSPELAGSGLVSSRDQDRPAGPPPRCRAAPISADLFIPNERWYQLRDPIPLAEGEGAADRYLTEEEFKALVRPAIVGPNGLLCEPPVNGGCLSPWTTMTAVWWRSWPPAGELIPVEPRTCRRYLRAPAAGAG